MAQIKKKGKRLKRRKRRNDPKQARNRILHVRKGYKMGNVWPWPTLEIGSTKMPTLR